MIRPPPKSTLFPYTTLFPSSTNNNGSAPASRVTTTVDERADLSVSKTGPPTVNAAQKLTYTIPLTNNRPSHSATFMEPDTLPAGVTFVSASNGGTPPSAAVT